MRSCRSSDSSWIALSMPCEIKIPGPRLWLGWKILVVWWPSNNFPVFTWERLIRGSEMLQGGRYWQVLAHSAVTWRCQHNTTLIPSCPWWQICPWFAFASPVPRNLLKADEETQESFAKGRRWAGWQFSIPKGLFVFLSVVPRFKECGRIGSTKMHKLHAVLVRARIA